MKRSPIATVLSLVATLGLAGAASASSGSQKFDLPLAGNIGSVALQPGSYELRWDGEGQDLEVSVVKSGQVLVTMQAKVVELDKPNPRGSVNVMPAADGSNTVTQIKLAKKAMAIRFGEEVARGSSHPVEKKADNRK